MTIHEPTRATGPTRAHALKLALLSATLAVPALAVANTTSAQPSTTITVWTPHVTPERIAGQEAVAAAFTEATGIGVNVVALGGADQNTSLVTGAASGDVPDVILHAPDQTAAWASQGLLDVELPQQIIDSLGADTFAEQALTLVTVDGTISAVPSDGWGHIVFYRSDLLDAAGIDAPTTVAELAAAATALSGGSVSGMALGGQVGNPFTTESLESMLQPTGCDLVTDGEVTIDSDTCVEALGLFRELVDSSVAGQFDVQGARSAYLSGNAAMLVFSSHFLDELAGLDPNNPLACDECTDNPRFLAENTGMITVLNPGEDGSGRQYGSTLNYGIPVGANAEAAQAYIEYVLSEGYVDTLAIATEGRVPLRAGNADNPTEYVDAWGALPFGVDQSEGLSIADVYGEEMVAAVHQGATSVRRWGYGTPDAQLAGLVFSQHLLAQTIEPLLGGGDPADTAAAMAAEVQSVKDELGS